MPLRCLQLVGGKARLIRGNKGHLWALPVPSTGGQTHFSVVGCCMEGRGEHGQTASSLEKQQYLGKESMLWSYFLFPFSIML